MEVISNITPKEEQALVRKHYEKKYGRYSWAKLNSQQKADYYNENLENILKRYGLR